MRWKELNKTFMMISYQNNFLVSMIGIQIKQKQLLTNKFILIFKSICGIYQNNVRFDNGLSDRFWLITAFFFHEKNTYTIMFNLKYFQYGVIFTKHGLHYSVASSNFAGFSIAILPQCAESDVDQYTLTDFARYLSVANSHYKRLKKHILKFSCCDCSSLVITFLYVGLCYLLQVLVHTTILLLTW